MDVFLLHVFLRMHRHIAGPNSRAVRRYMRAAPRISLAAEDDIDRVLRKTHRFRKLSQEEVERLTDEEVDRLEDAYDVARATEIMRAIREGRMEVMSGKELEDKLDRLCAEADEEGH